MGVQRSKNLGQHNSSAGRGIVERSVTREEPVSGNDVAIGGPQSARRHRQEWRAMERLFAQ